MASAERSGASTDLEALIQKNGWEQRFRAALEAAREQVVKNEIGTFPQIDPQSPQRIIDPTDLETYYEYVDWLAHWCPREVVVKGVSHRNVYNDIVNFYFILAQDPVKDLQVPITPGPGGRLQEVPVVPVDRRVRRGSGAVSWTRPESAASIPTLQGGAGVQLGRVHAAAVGLPHLQPVLRPARQARDAPGGGARRPRRRGVPGRLHLRRLVAGRPDEHDHR